MNNTDNYKKTLSNSLLQMANRPKGRVALQYKTNQKWQALNWQEFFDEIKSIGKNLALLKLQRQQKIALLANNSIEWSLFDAAAIGLGLITLAIPTNVQEEDLLLILQTEQPRLIFIDDLDNLHLTQKILTKLNLKCQIVTSIEIQDKLKNCLSLTQFKAQNTQSVAKYYFEEQLHLADEDEIVTQIYTSSSTGHLKSISLSHRNILSQISETFPLLGTNPDDLTVSYLPYSHILGRIETWGHWYIGFQLIIANSPERLRHLMNEFNPTFIMAVPRVFEKIYALAQIQISRSWWLNNFLNPLLYLQKNSNFWLINKSAQLLTDNVFNQVQRLFGRRLRFAFCGGAALSNEISQFFKYAGVLILEGYGMSEATGLLTVNRPYDSELGTVGKPIGDVQLKLTADGEILVKSKKIASLNFHTPDGWLSTGDIGKWSKRGNLIILDRKNSYIKTQQGKLISPEMLRLKLKNHPLIDQVYFHGSDCPFVVALISLDHEKCHQWISSSNHAKDISQHEKDLMVQNEIHNYIQKINKTLLPHEQIIRFAISPVAFTQENGYLSPSQKIKSHIIQIDFAALITKLYQ